MIFVKKPLDTIDVMRLLIMSRGVKQNLVVARVGGAWHFGGGVPIAAGCILAKDGGLSCVNDGLFLGS